MIQGQKRLVSVTVSDTLRLARGVTQARPPDGYRNLPRRNTSLRRQEYGET